MYLSFNPSRPAWAPMLGHRDPVAWLERRGINLPPDASARKVETYIRQHPQKFSPLITFIQSDEFKAQFKKEIRRINHVAQEDSAGRRLGLEVGLLKDPVSRHKKPVLQFWSLAGHSYGVNFLKMPRTEIMRQLRAVRVNAEKDAGYIYAKTAHPHPHISLRPERISPQQVSAHRPKGPLYFAYGSNLNPVQFKERCPDAVPKAPAELKGWRVVYVGHSGNWQGAVANIKHTGNPNDSVKGYLFRLSKSDKANLDRKEGLGRAYKHSYFGVASRNEYGEVRLRPPSSMPQNGKTPPIFTYTRVVCNEPERLPSQTYNNVIIHGAKYWKLGQAYIRNTLESVVTNGQRVPRLEKLLLRV